MDLAVCYSVGKLRSRLTYLEALTDENDCETAAMNSTIRSCQYQNGRLFDNDIQACFYSSEMFIEARDVMGGRFSFLV